MVYGLQCGSWISPIVGDVRANTRKFVGGAAISFGETVGFLLHWIQWASMKNALQYQDSNAQVWV